MSKTFYTIPFIFCFMYSGAWAQPGISFEIKKPPKFESKTLGSEKTGDKKFTVPRRFVQNTFTHYNYYFNAYNRLNEVIARAKNAHKDDFTQLLSFYNYSLQETSVYKTDLDSVIYKSTTGVLIHDLRNDWIDNLYLLIGRAYYLRNDLDSAYLTFQYVNYAFSPKEKDGYDKVIGSNQDEKSNAFSISTKETSNIVKKTFSRPPSRNESLIWQIKTYLAKDELAEAAGLIETLKNDPLFPERLELQLKEVQALWFYNQQAYDSAALYLEKVVGLAENNQEQARWEYLIAQLHERSGHRELAREFYERAIRHSIDPVLEVYARLNAIRQNKEDEKKIQEAIDELLKMARKDRYLQYRDIIYYTAALIDLERNNPEGAKSLLLKSVTSSTTNTAQKSKSFMALGDLSFALKQYPDAKSFYDSVDIRYIPAANYKAFADRQAALEKIVFNTGIISRQDSLQRIAGMSPDEREVFVKKLLKQLRKKQGLGDEDERIINNNSSADNNNNAPANDLFGSQAAKGDWYFYNAALKSKGFNEFKVRWGTRANADNWRRFAAISRPSVSPGQTSTPLSPGNQAASFAPVILSYEALLENIPLTPEKQKISKDSSEHALFALGKSFMDGLEDYPSAIVSLEKLLRDYPATVHTEEALFNLYYCYRKVGDPRSQEQIRQALMSKFPNGKFASLLSNSNRAQSPDSVLKSKATKRYEDIYNLFIEGNFKEATVQKKQADSVYGQNYWTPQLLYIEAVYYIRQREDSVAKQILTKILQLYPKSPMQPKTANLLSVLSRRKQIEDYLTKLDIERPREDEKVIIGNDPPVKQAVASPPADLVVVPKLDTSLSSAITNEPEKEANAAAIKNSRAATTIKPEISAGISPQNPGNLIKDVPKQENQQGKETLSTTINNNNNNRPTQQPAVQFDIPKRKTDSLPIVKRTIVPNSEYNNDPSQVQYVVLVLDKVDPVYVTEARNAFNRYHRERYSDKKIETIALALSDDVKFVLIKNFENASIALDYIQKTRKLTQTDIIPWLTAQKYSFVMISEPNLELLKTRKDITAYKKFLAEAFPEQF